MSDYRCRHFQDENSRFIRTSTYNPNSTSARIGEFAEIIVCRELQKLAPSHVAVQRRPGSETISAVEAYTNSQNGDLEVRSHGQLSHVIEVKSSLEYPNAAIDGRELSESSARYLVALTTAGLWACTMDRARRVAVRRGGCFGDFWIVYYDRMMTIPIKETLR